MKKLDFLVFSLFGGAEGYRGQLWGVFHSMNVRGRLEQAPPL
jgi:hypothetical protein